MQHLCSNPAQPDSIIAISRMDGQALVKFLKIWHSCVCLLRAQGMLMRKQSVRQSTALNVVVA